ncbi:MAG: tetratricopeptide repeat protein [Planctomycetota bacterium]
MPDEKLSSIVQAAVSISDGAKRREFLQQSSAGNQRLFARLQMIVGSLPESQMAAARPPAAKAHQSVIHSISGDHRPAPSVYLDDSIDGETAPVVQPNSTEAPVVANGSRYQLQGEIARGGMGAILKGRDTNLGRNLAVKVLLDSHKDNDLAVQRFIEEAQIGGQLQHPGITPVYELGRFDDRRPFFTMKLVNGETLAWLLMTRRSVDSDRAKLLGIFEQVCQTLAYAHSRRVIHRDLKPANIMVGSFGEVQVMDWGLAKVLPKEGQQVEKKAADLPPKDQSIIQTVRSPRPEGSSEDGSGQLRHDASVGSQDTQFGSAMGTPAYMPPEQAMGEVEQMDRRADVFGLGAILCEILTGEPPYVAETASDILRLAMRGQLESAFERLDHCQADRALIDLTRRCLSADPRKRPADASYLADAMAKHFQTAEDKLQQAKVKQAEEAARTVEERKRRRVALALAASVLLMLCLGGGAWMQIQDQRRAQASAANEKLDEALGKAKLHQGLAKDQPLERQDAELAKAIISAKQAVELSQQEGVETKKREEVARFLADLQESAKEVDAALRERLANQRIRDRLDIIRVSHADGGTKLNVARQSQSFAAERTSQQYRGLFESAGIDVEQREVEQAAAQIRQSEISADLISALDSWASTIQTQALLSQQYSAVAAGDWQTAVKIAKARLKESPKDSHRWLTLAPLLILSGDLDGYQRHLEQMVKRFHGTDRDWASGHVIKACTLLENSSAPEPSVTSALERALDGGDVKEYMTLKWGLRAMLEYRRDNARRALECANTALEHDGHAIAKAYAVIVRAMAQHRLGQVDGATKSLESASESVAGLIKEFRFRGSVDTSIAVLLLREATSLIHPETPKIEIDKVYEGYTKEGLAKAFGRFQLRERLMRVANAADDNDGRTSIRSAIVVNEADVLVSTAADPNIRQESAEMVAWLAQALYHAKRYEPAVHILQAALEREPTDFWLNYELSRSLAKLQRTDEALGYARSALAIQPRSSAAVWMVVANLHDALRTDESMHVFRQWLSTSAMNVDELVSLSRDLRLRGRLEHAEAVARKAIEVDSDVPDGYEMLAFALHDLERYDEEVQAAEKAVELAPDDRDANFRLAYALAAVGEPEKSIAAYRRVIEIDPEYAAAYNNLGNLLREQGELQEAVRMHREAFRMVPGKQMYHQNLVTSLTMFSDDQSSPRALVDEIATLRNRGPGPQARIARYRRELELNPKDKRARLSLAIRLIEAGEYKEAEKECRILVDVLPEISRPHVLLASVLHRQGKIESALESYRKAMRVAPENWIPHQRFAAAAHAHAIGNRLEGRATTFSDPPQFHPEDLELNAESAALLDEAIEAYKHVLSLHKSPENSSGEDSSQRRLDGFGAANPDVPVREAIEVSQALSLALRARGRIEEAEAIEQKQAEAIATIASRGEPGKRPGYSFLQQIAAMNRRGESQKAIDTMRDHLAAKPDDRLVADQLGQTLKTQGEIDEAEKVYDSIMEKWPDQNTGYLGLGRVYAFGEPRRPEKAIEVFDRGIAAGLPETQTAFLHMMKGSVYLSEKDWDQALESYNAALKLDPKLGLAFSGIGEVLMAQGKTDEAIEAQRKSVQLSPRDGTCHRSFAQTLISIVDDNGNYPHASEALKHALQAVDTFRFSELAGSPPSAWLHTVGLIYYRKDDFEKALKYLKYAEDGGYKSVSNTALLAMTYWRLGEQDTARAVLQHLSKDESDESEQFSAEDVKILAEAARTILPY